MCRRCSSLWLPMKSRSLPSTAVTIEFSPSDIVEVSLTRSWLKLARLLLWLLSIFVVDDDVVVVVMSSQCEAVTSLVDVCESRDPSDVPRHDEVSDLQKKDKIKFSVLMSLFNVGSRGAALNYVIQRRDLPWFYIRAQGIGYKRH